jgi:hypothetical protein
MAEEGGNNSGHQIFINATVHDKEVRISCGNGSQRIKWLGHVAIARYDEELYQGWKVLGVPVHMEKMETGEPLMLGAVIKDILVDGDRVKVDTSIDPR